MQRHGRTKAGRERYFCPACKRTETEQRPDTRLRHERDRLIAWLTGTESKAAIAKWYGLTRQALSYEFRQFFEKDPENPPPSSFKAERLIVDAKFIHGSDLCTLIALTEADRIFWQFAGDENSETWSGFLSRFAPPKVVVADGEKGVSHFVKRHWPQTRFQRCHFHMVKLVIQYLSRNPKEEAGKEILDLVYRLKTVKTEAEKEKWILLFKIWEKQYAGIFAAKVEAGGYRYRKLRSVRNIVRRALPDLFTYLDAPGCPTTTNDVEGWINATLAEALRRHRGMRLSQKKTLVSIILSHLTRGKPKRRFS